MTKLNNTNFTIRLLRGLRAAIYGSVPIDEGRQGMPLYTTDTKQLFIHDGTRPEPVLTLDMAVTHENCVVIHNAAIVHHY